MAVQIEGQWAATKRGNAASDGALRVCLRARVSRESSFELDVDFVALPGITVLFGASGAGKTTILDCIAGLRRPERGRVLVGDKVLLDSDTNENTPIKKRQVGYVFDTLALFPHMTAAENIGFGLPHLTPDERASRIAAISNSFGIHHLLDKRPREISGGERQRVALARTLVTNPAVLLLDEPLSALDSDVKSRILADLRRWNESHRIPILYITHDRTEVFALAEQVLVLNQGKIIAQGTPFQVLETPRQEYVARLAGFENIFSARVEALHEASGTMTCAVGETRLEVPLARVQVGTSLSIGVRAGDVLLAAVRPEMISARNVIRGRILSLEHRDVLVIATVDCGVTFEVHITPQAKEALGLSEGSSVWLVLKTHSCHFLLG